MGADRFYCPQIKLGQACRLEGDEARHLAKVRRVVVGASVELFDGRGQAVIAEVVGVGRDRVELLAKSPAATQSTSVVALTLAVAIPKGDRFDWLIEKATELGVDRIVPLLAERSTVDPRSTKLDRLRRAIIEASKQCRRNTLMKLDDPHSWEEWLLASQAGFDHYWIAHPGGANDWTATRLEQTTRVAVIIGPEGGLSDIEVTQAQAAGWHSIDLTPTILRIETAAIAVAAGVMIRAADSLRQSTL